MAINTTTSSLHLNLPSSGPSQARTQAPNLVTIHPSVLAQIIDHHTRRPLIDDVTSSRVIGTLLGVRSEGASGSEIEIRSCFALLHSEDEHQVAVDMDYHNSMMELVTGGKNRKEGGEVIVGWYSSSPVLTPYSALLQNFFSQECAAHGAGAVHLTFDTEVSQAGGLGVKAYVSSQVGSLPKPENCVFMPVPVSLKYNMSERAGLDLLAPKANNNASLPPLATLADSLAELSNQLSTIQQYVASINNGSNSSPADPEVGRYLLEAVGRWKADAEVESGEGGVKKGLQDLLSVSYLSTLLRSQVELSGRLNLLA